MEIAEIKQWLNQRLSGTYEFEDKGNTVTFTKRHTLSITSVNIDLTKGIPILRSENHATLPGIILSLLFFPISTVIIILRMLDNQKIMDTNVQAAVAEVYGQQTPVGQVPNQAAPAGYAAQPAAAGEAVSAVTPQQTLPPYTEAEIRSKALVPIIAGAIVTVICVYVFCCFSYVGPILGGIASGYLLMRQFELSRMGEYESLKNPFTKYATIGCALGSMVILIIAVVVTGVKGQPDTIRIVLGILGYILNFAVMIILGFVGAWLAYYARNNLFPPKH